MLDFLPDDLRPQLTQVWSDTAKIWNDGGWAMYAIATIAFVLFGVGVQVKLRLREKGFQKVGERNWRQWIVRPAERRGPIGELLDFVTGGRTIQDTATYFEQLRTTELVPFERDLRVMKICVSAAPLVGLLGTVTGMLATFDALGAGSGGDKTMEMVASGISEALITTETGLVIALPGLFFQYHLSRSFERYRIFLAHLETVCTQTLHRDQSVLQQEAVNEAAQMEVQRIFAQRLQAQGAPA